MLKSALSITGRKFQLNLFVVVYLFIYLFILFIFYLFILSCMSSASLLAAACIKVPTYEQFVFCVSAESFVLAGVISCEQ
jgi:hypothetical protein